MADCLRMPVSNCGIVIMAMVSPRFLCYMPNSLSLTLLWNVMETLGNVVLLKEVGHCGCLPLRIMAEFSLFLFSVTPPPPFFFQFTQAKAILEKGNLTEKMPPP